MPQKPVGISSVGPFLIDNFLAFLTKLYCRENSVSLFAASSGWYLASRWCLTVVIYLSDVADPLPSLMQNVCLNNMSSGFSLSSARIKTVTDTLALKSLNSTSKHVSDFILLCSYNDISSKAKHNSPVPHYPALRKCFGSFILSQKREHKFDPLQ